VKRELPSHDKLTLTHSLSHYGWFLYKPLRLYIEIHAGVFWVNKNANNSHSVHMNFSTSGQLDHHITHYFLESRGHHNPSHVDIIFISLVVANQGSLPDLREITRAVWDNKVLASSGGRVRARICHYHTGQYSPQMRYPQRRLISRLLV